MTDTPIVGLIAVRTHVKGLTDKQRAHMSDVAIGIAEDINDYAQKLIGDLADEFMQTPGHVTVTLIDKGLQ